MCQQLRDEADARLGARGAWRPFFAALADRRLTPTPWLNASYREPLYLTDVPRHIPDERSEAERAFPELFRAKLTAEGYDVKTTPVSVLNPQHRDFVHKAALAKQRR